MFVRVGRSPLHGQGCFATQEVPDGEVVARAKLIALSPEETEIVSRTRLKNYLFFLKDGPTPDGPFHSALAMGPVSFCNHCPDPNCRFAVLEEHGEVVLTACRAIEQNEEITIDYGEYATEII